MTQTRAFGDFDLGMGTGKVGMSLSNPSNFIVVTTEILGHVCSVHNHSLQDFFHLQPAHCMENHPLESSHSNALDTRQPKLQGWRGNDARKNKNASGKAEHSMVHISRSSSLLQLCHPSNTTYREDFAIEQSLRLSSKIWEIQGKSKNKCASPESNRGLNDGNVEFYH